MKVIFLDIDGVLNTIDTFKLRKDIYNNYGVIIPRIDFYRVKFLKEINKKPILPSDGELQENPRSRSAKLRIAEKI